MHSGASAVGERETGRALRFVRQGRLYTAGDAPGDEAKSNKVEQILLATLVARTNASDVP